MSNLADRVKELETRINAIKDWKAKYEKDSKIWKQEQAFLTKQVEDAEDLKEALGKFLPVMPLARDPLAVGATTKNINLEETQMNVVLSHKERDISMTTGTVNGKILFCAVTDLPKEGFSEAELSDCLKEKGWNVGHNTLAPSLGTLVRDGNLIKKATKPLTYRLPLKLKIDVKNET